MTKTKTKSKSTLIALGGNALIRDGQAGTAAQLHDNATAMARSIHTLRAQSWEVVLVHGNGPQVGNLAIQQEDQQSLVPAQPLYSLGAMTQGQIGSLLSLALRGTVGSPTNNVAAVVTHVVVSPDDPTFEKPTKPIGPFFNAAEAKHIGARRGWEMAWDAGRGFRRVVASPEPLEFLEIQAIRALVDSGAVVIAAGGGGVPVVADGEGYTGLDVVIDKDYAAARLATLLGVDTLVLATGVEHVMLEFGTSRQRPLFQVTADQMDVHLADGQFPEGSMAPKVRAALRFLRAGGRQVLITTHELATAYLTRAQGSVDGGTLITLNEVGANAASSTQKRRSEVSA
jgi:carbamate kinase